MPAQPTYGPPGFQPPAQPIYGPPGFSPPPQPRKPRALPITLVSIAIALVLCVGGLAVIGVLTDDGARKSKSANITVVEPATLGARPKLDSPKFTQIAKTMLDKAATDFPGVTKSVGPFYGVPAKDNVVIALAIAAPIAHPDIALSASLTSASHPVEETVVVNTGSAGGNATCGTTKISGSDMAICVWTDEGSLGMLIWYNSTVSAAVAEFPALRAEIKKVG
ncbi:hypothetical protein [Actinoplanes regularis]|uniref:hypothetical protein n=1 Tax=Actinoplanes regularis TaxID=52697 RepID=UPI0011782706|nr:hypothetical protein [Actinoplanes regularis]